MRQRGSHDSRDKCEPLLGRASVAGELSQLGSDSE